MATGASPSSRAGGSATAATNNDKRVPAAEQKIDALVDEYRLRMNVNQANIDKAELDKTYERNFARHRLARRLAMGMIKGVDLASLRKSIFAEIGEQVVLELHDYWLAYCMIAFAHWINDNRREAETALKYGLKANKEKTTLFFALICYRAGRLSSFRNWAFYYFCEHDPAHIDQTCSVFINAFVNGVVGETPNNFFAEKITSWFKATQPQALEKKERFWYNNVKRMYEKSKASSLAEKYPFLKQFCSEFSVLDEIWHHEQLHQAILQSFKKCIEIEPDPKYLDNQMESILTKLIDTVEPQENELLKKMRRCDLIEEHKGDIAAAEKQLQGACDVDSADIIPFAELICDAVPNNSLFYGTSPALRRLAVILNRDLIKQAFSQYNLSMLRKLPEEFNVSLPQIEIKFKLIAEDEKITSDFSNSIKDEVKRQRAGLQKPKDRISDAKGTIGLKIVLLLIVFSLILMMASLGDGCVVFFLLFFMIVICKSISSTYTNLDKLKTELKDAEQKIIDFENRALTVTLPALQAAIGEVRQCHDELSKAKTNDDLDIVSEYFEELSSADLFKGI